MTTSHVCDFVWRSLRDLGLFEGKDMTMRSINAQQTSWDGAPIVGNPPEIVVAVPTQNGRGAREFLGVRRSWRGLSCPCNVFSVVEQESLGQRAGRGSSYNRVVHLTNDNICQVRFLEDAKQQGPKWLKVCLFGLFLK